jgi:dinuclear metal center YbgI/SA1388 family protein
MNLSRLIEEMEQIAPTRYAEPWDNVGLLTGDPAQSISNVLLTIDYTRASADEAQRQGCDAVIAYHPPIFKPFKQVTAGSLIFDAIRRGVAIYSPHTALDVADGGTNDVLADVLGLVDRSPLKALENKASQLKLVTFAPESVVEKISSALFDAGAGHIGNYSSCSFRSPGTGTFFGEEGTNPTIGRPGQLETANEIRIETIAPISKLPQIIAALRAAHPYEEPAFDLLQLAAPPVMKGLGRVGNFPVPTRREDIFARLKQGLNVSQLLIAGPETGTVQKAAVCAGACGDLLDYALSQKADIYITGEMRHHDALKAAEAEMTVVCTLHSNSERVTLKHVRDRLSSALPGIKFTLSSADRDPFAIR